METAFKLNSGGEYNSLQHLILNNIVFFCCILVVLVDVCFVDRFDEVWKETETKQV